MYGLVKALGRRMHTSNLLRSICLLTSLSPQQFGQVQPLRLGTARSFQFHRFLLHASTAMASKYPQVTLLVDQSWLGQKEWKRSLNATPPFKNCVTACYSLLAFVSPPCIRLTVCEAWHCFLPGRFAPYQEIKCQQRHLCLPSTEWLLGNRRLLGTGFLTNSNWCTKYLDSPQPFLHSHLETALKKSSIKILWLRMSVLSHKLMKLRI